MYLNHIEVFKSFADILIIQLISILNMFNFKIMIQLFYLEKYIRNYNQKFEKK